MLTGIIDIMDTDILSLERRPSWSWTLLIKPETLPSGSGVWSHRGPCKCRALVTHGREDPRPVCTLFLPQCVSSLYNYTHLVFCGPEQWKLFYFFPSIIQRAELWKVVRVRWAGAGIKYWAPLLCKAVLVYADAHTRRLSP